MPEIGVRELLSQLRSQDAQLRLAAASELGKRCFTTELTDPSADEIWQQIKDVGRDIPDVRDAFRIGYSQAEHEYLEQLDLTELIEEVQCDEEGSRIAAARELANRFNPSRPPSPLSSSPLSSPSLAEVAKVIAEVNRRTGDVAGPFARSLLYFGILTDRWQGQSDFDFTDWLADVLCSSPDVDDEFAAYGLVDDICYQLKESTGIARRILDAGKPWRAFLIASASEVSSEEDRRLMEDFALVDDLRAATRATFCLAHAYCTVHPRAAEAGWVVEEQLPPYQLFWCRFPDEKLPHRVWGWRLDRKSFSSEDAIAAMQLILRPELLGSPTRSYGSWSGFDTQGFRVCLDRPGMRRREVFGKVPRPTEFSRFQLRPMRREPWVNVPRVQAVGARMLAAQQASEGRG